MLKRRIMFSLILLTALVGFTLPEGSVANGTMAAVEAIDHTLTEKLGAGPFWRPKTIYHDGEPEPGCVSTWQFWYSCSCSEPDGPDCDECEEWDELHEQCNVGEDC